jgi:glycosyltransferase involved in cell wall biosynthesis
MLALVLIVLNEESRIGRCMASAAPYVDEIIVVDTGSSDLTKELALQQGAKVFDYVWTDDFAAARNFSLECSSAEWNLVLDADEIIEQFDREAVNKFMSIAQGVGRIERISEAVGHGEIDETRDFITRLIPRGIRFKGRIHEQVDTILPRYNVPIIVKHDGYLQTSKSGRNIPLLIREINENPIDPYYFFQLAKEYNGIERLVESAEYFSNAYYLLKGNERYAPNVVTEYIYLLLKTKEYNKALEIVKRDHNWLSRFPDYYFACGVFYLDIILSNNEQYLSYLPLIEDSYQRCLEIGETNNYDSVVGTGSYAAHFNLGNYYEVLGYKDQALTCYRKAAHLGYRKAELRLIELNEE